MDTRTVIVLVLLANTASAFVSLGTDVIEGVDIDYAVPIVFDTYSVGAYTPIVGSNVPVTISYTNPSNIQSSVYVKYGTGSPTLVDSNSVVAAGASSTSYDWITTNLYPLTYNTRGCVNDTGNNEVCSAGTIQVRFNTVSTTTIPAPLWTATTLPSDPIGSMAMRPCFAYLKNFQFIRAIVCPFATAFGETP